MDFKIKITCKKCSCAFELRPIDFKQRDFTECPNCGQQLPDGVYQNLKIGVTALGAVPEIIPEDANFFSPDVQFKLEVKSYSLGQELLHRDSD